MNKKMTHVYIWRNNPVRETYFGCLCRIIKTMKRNSVLIEFMNGDQLVTSRRALRRKEDADERKLYC